MGGWEDGLRVGDGGGRTKVVGGDDDAVFEFQPDD